MTLRRTTPVGSEPENITLTFLQPLGLRWPLPSDQPRKVKEPPRPVKKRELREPLPFGTGEQFEAYDQILTSERGRTWMR